MPIGEVLPARGPPGAALAGLERREERVGLLLLLLPLGCGRCSGESECPLSPFMLPPCCCCCCNCCCCCCCCWEDCCRCGWWWPASSPTNTSPPILLLLLLLLVVVAVAWAACVEGGRWGWVDMMSVMHTWLVEARGVVRPISGQGRTKGGRRKARQLKHASTDKTSSFVLRAL